MKLPNQNLSVNTERYKCFKHQTSLPLDALKLVSGINKYMQLKFN